MSLRNDLIEKAPPKQPRVPNFLERLPDSDREEVLQLVRDWVAEDPELREVFPSSRALCIAIGTRFGVGDMTVRQARGIQELWK